MTEYAPLWAGAIVCIGAIAAFMSTADSQILAMSSLITKDGLPAVTEIKEENEKQIGRILIIILAIIGLALAYDPPDTIFDIVSQAFTGLAVLIPTTVAVLYWDRVKANSCINICDRMNEYISCDNIFPWKYNYYIDDNIVINSGVTVTKASSPLIIYAKGTITVNGTIDMSGKGGAGGSGNSASSGAGGAGGTSVNMQQGAGANGGAGSAGSSGGSYPGGQDNPAQNGGSGGAGGAGGANSSSVSPNTKHVTKFTMNETNFVGAGGGGGGAGGNGGNSGFPNGGTPCGGNTNAGDGGNGGAGGGMVV